MLRKLRNRWGGVRLITRNGNNFTSRFPLAVDAVARRSAAKLLTKDEARRIAANIAKLPELSRKS